MSIQSIEQKQLLLRLTPPEAKNYFQTNLNLKNNIIKNVRSSQKKMSFPVCGKRWALCGNLNHFIVGCFKNKNETRHAYNINNNKNCP